MIIYITQELSFETICENHQEYQTYLNNPPLYYLMDYIGNEYGKTIVNKYEINHDPLPQLLHSRQVCDN